MHLTDVYNNNMYLHPVNELSRIQKSPPFTNFACSTFQKVQS